MPRVNFSRHHSLWRRLSRSRQKRLLLREGSYYLSRFLDSCTFRQPEKWTEENSNIPFSCSQYWTGDGLQLRLMLGVFSTVNDVNLFLMIFSRMNFHCKLVPVQYREYEYGPGNLCLRKTRSGTSHNYRDAIVFEKLRFQNVFRPHENKKSGVSKFLLFEERFRKTPFSWRISVDGKPNRRNKAAFLNFSGVVWTLPDRLYFGGFYCAL